MDRKTTAKELLRVAKSLTAKKEYYIWGVPPGKSDEQILLSAVEGTPLRSMAEAKHYAKVLEERYGARKTRVQVIDLEGEFDWMKETGLRSGSGRLASELLKVARELVAMDFPTQDALDKYLKDHPDADRGKHRVRQTKKAPGEKEAPKGLPARIWDEVDSLDKMDEKALADHVDKMIESKGLDQARRHFKTLYDRLDRAGAGMNEAGLVQEALNHIEKREGDKK